MDPFTISMAVAPLVLSSAKLTMLISAVRDSYISAPTTLTATLTECKIIHITLSKIQGLVYKNESDLSSRLTAQAPLREAFDGALTGCRMTLAALNLELDKLAEPRKSTNPLDIGFKAKARLIWKEDIMKQLLDQTRSQMLSLRCLIELLESETQADMFRLLKQNTADIQKILHRAKSIRSYQGFDDDQSSFNFTRQSAAYGLVPSYEAQLAQSSTYQRAQAAAAEELLARKIELLDEKYALEERIDGLLLDGDTKDEKVARLENEALLKGQNVAGLESDILLKDEEIAHLKQDNSLMDDRIRRQGHAILLKDQHLLSLEKKIRKLELTQNVELKEWEDDIINRRFDKNGNPRASCQGSREGANIDAENRAVDTLLQSAAGDGHVKVVKALLDLGFNKEVADEDGYTPLHWAASNGHLEVVKILLENGANKETTQAEGSTPLNSAAGRGHVEIVKLLLEKRANKEAAENYGGTPLNSAAEEGNVEVVKLLLDEGANKEATNKEGRTPLNSSADRGHVEVVEVLLQIGANTEARSRDGQTPLHSAVNGGHVEVVQMLIQIGANMEATDWHGRTTLHRAANLYDAEVVKLLVDSGANIEATALDKWRPMHLAAFKGRDDVLRILLRQGANKEAANDYGETPLHFAAYRGHVDIVKTLIKEGANSGASNLYRRTSFHRAKFKRHVEVVLLLEEKANEEAYERWKQLDF